MKRLKQYLAKASFSSEADRFSALECVEEIAGEIERLRTALLIAQRFCNSMTAIPINEALQVPNAEIERLRSVLDTAAHDIQCGNSVGLARRLRESMVPNAEITRGVTTDQNKRGA